MTKVLVTGGAGFIGSRLCERLLERGDEVLILDDFSSGSRDNIAHLKLQVIEDSVMNIQAHRDTLRGVERVYHLAALISGYDSLNDPESYIDLNLSGLARLLDVARDWPGARMVFASSSTVYGNGTEATRSENTPPAPLSMYALSKLAGEHMLAMYAPLRGFSHVSLRLFNVYGPRQSPHHPYANVTCKFSHAAAHGDSVRLYGDGAQSRDFVFVDDVVDAFLLVSDQSRDTIYNVGTGVDASIKTLLQEVERAADCRLEVEQMPPWPNDINAIRADISRIHDEFGFQARVALPEGLKRTVEWFRDDAAKSA